MNSSLFYRLFPVFAFRGKTDLSIPLDVSVTDDAIDHLRSEVLDRLIRVVPEKNNYILGVTSCDYHEGAYQTSFNLANSFAQIRNRVLVVDLDFRRAQISTALCSSTPKASLNDVFTSKNPTVLQRNISSAICSLENSNLEILPAIKTVRNPSVLLEAIYDSALLKQLGERYDIIVCALPPASIYADAAMAARELDGIVLSVRENHTKREQLTTLFSQSRIINEKTVGVMYYKTK